MARQSFILETEADTAALGAALSAVLGPGDILRLEGPLGAGKTALARALIQAKCGPVEVPSPTYTLVETYEAADALIWHFDLYRIEKPEELRELGFEEAIEDGLCLIEWPERAGAAMPRGAIDLSISLVGERRTVDIEGLAPDACESVAAAYENRLKKT